MWLILLNPCPMPVITLPLCFGSPSVELELILGEESCPRSLSQKMAVGQEFESRCVSLEPGVSLLSLAQCLVLQSSIWKQGGED